MTRLDEIEERAKAATPGPWEWVNNVLFANVADMIVRQYPFHQTSPGDAAFIAAARTDVPALVSALRLALDGLLCDCMVPQCRRSVRAAALRALEGEDGNG